jgi:hypothetical protein
MEINGIVELLFSLLEKSIGNRKKLISIIKILIKVNENVLKNFIKHCTKNINSNIEIINIKFSDSVDEKQYSYEQIFNSEFSNFMEENKKIYEEIFNKEFSDPVEKKQTTYEEMYEINNRVLLSLLKSLKTSKFKFLEDLGEYSQDNEEFTTTYLRNQKKIGMKKLVQIEFLKTILDIFVNAYNIDHNRSEIIELIEMMKNKNIFYNCHKLFFDFPNCNIYQIFYNQIFDIVLNISSPNNLVEYFFKYTDEKKAERNLVKDLMDNFFKKMKFTFSDSNASFDLNISFEVTLLNKIDNSENKILKNYFIMIKT